MKKLFIVLLAVAVIFVVAAGCANRLSGQDAPAASPAVEATDEPVFATPVPTVAVPTDPPVEEESFAAGRVDMQALYNAYPADSVYAVVGDREITWGEYYEWLGTYILSAEAYMDTMAVYGYSMGWDSAYAEDANLAEYVIANLDDNLRAYTGIGLFAAENGVEVTDEDLDAKRAEDMSSIIGEDATEEDWAALLVANYLTENVYRAQAKAQLELTRLQQELYGENGEKISIANLQHYIEDQGYLHCNHILFLTIDMDTYAALDEDEAAAKKAQAEAVAAELQAIEDRDELLARFAELKTELCEDSGKYYYPDGYLFTPGTMVAVFEDTTRSLADYQVSDPVLSEYGYHVIIRLPIDADSELDSGGTIGAAAASELMAADLDAIVDRLDFALAPGVQALNLLDYVVEFAEK